MRAIPDRIQRDILLQATPEVVWRAVSQPEQLAGWFCDAAVIDPRPGGRGVFTFEQRAVHAPVVMPIVVEHVDPPRSWAYRWLQPPGAEARPNNSLLVEFLLEPAGNGTRVHVVESGLLAIGWSDEDKASYVEYHHAGWEAHLEHLRQFVATSS
jgi:uncharacterized protein YndB with AHSA1/START domain